MNEFNLCGGQNLESEPGSSSWHAAAGGHVHTIPARRNVCHPNEWSDFITIICRGWAASSLALADGRRQIVSFLLPGDIGSWASLFAPTSDRLIESLTEVDYRNFKRNEVMAALFERPDLFEKFLRRCIGSKVEADQLILDLGRRTADERIARLILVLMERLAERGMNQGDTIEFPLRQRHIADAMGLTPVHVSKVLSEFRRRGLIEVSKRSLTVLDPVGLRRVAAVA